MRSIFLVLCLTFTFSLAAKPCEECRGKKSQRASEVYYTEYEGDIYHIAIYAGGYVQTLLSGFDLGKQVIFIKDCETYQSRKYTWISRDEFKHEYDNFIICSTSCEQWIKPIK